ncbi:MAG: LysR substrate-binding domain-containing protein [Arenicella sp.]
MKKRLPPLKWLLSFEVSARHLNFTQAAVELNLTQAAISQQVKALETHIGVALFKRLPRGLELTDAARAYLPIVHDSIERLTVATDEIFGQGRNRLLKVRVNLVFFTHWLAPRLNSFRQLYPEVGLSFSSHIWVVDQDKSGDMDIRYGHGTWTDLKSDRLTWDELIPVCSPGLLKDEVLSDPLAILKKYSLLHVIGYEEGWGHWLSKTGFSGVDISKGLQFDTLISALEMAVHGHGIALGRTSLVSGMLESGQLIAPFEQGVATDEAFYLTSPTHQYHPHADIFRSWLIGEAQSVREAQSGE